MGCSFTASKRPLPKMVGLPADDSIRPLSALQSGVAIIFARLLESYLPPSREVGGVVIYRCRGHPHCDGPTLNRKDPCYYTTGKLFRQALNSWKEGALNAIKAQIPSAVPYTSMQFLVSCSTCLYAAVCIGGQRVREANL